MVNAAALSTLLLARVLLAQSAQDFTNKAIDLIRSGDLKNAELSLQQAAKLSPNDPAVFATLGTVLAMEGNAQQAVLPLERAVKLDPANAPSRRNLAATLWQLGRLKEAHQNLDILLRADPQDKAATFLLGMVCEKEHDYPRSITLLESVPEAMDRQPDGRAVLASAYYHTGRQQDARQMLQQLASQAPNPKAVFTGGQVALEARDYDTAEHLLESIQTASPEASVLLAKIAALQGSRQMMLRYYNDAVTSFQKAAKLHPSLETSRNLADATWRSGHRPQAVSQFEELLKTAPRDAASRQSYAILLLEDGSLESTARAVELLKQVLTLGESAEARFQLANVELARGNAALARTYLERAIKLAPDDSRMHFAMSRVYRRQNLSADADRELAIYQHLKVTHKGGAQDN